MLLIECRFKVIIKNNCHLWQLIMKKHKNVLARSFEITAKN
ncbi:hypothetical protein MNBD_GAMMA20-444 [hydrothermal vent metagenome]|uniref:Uncharacterized protein n=1 Tax=hydrothermal vent metagenome TaxID=652676 RepID=A0A3B1AD99_9ZZZZ